MRKTLLPPGFRFHPTDVELVVYHLKRKIMGKKPHFEAIAEVDIYKHAPWDLSEKSCLRSGDLKWYFFCPRERKYGSGHRVNRSTDLGFWKATGKDRPVHYNNEVVGMIRTLIFHIGRAPKGDRTDWVMYEYRLEEKELANRGVALDAYMLCVIFKKNGRGPKNGAQYGAPFKEEDWSDDEDEECNDAEIVSSVDKPAPTCVLPNNKNSSLIVSSHVTESMCTGSSEAVTSANDSHSVAYDNAVASTVASDLLHEDDHLLALLANFSDESAPTPNANDNNENADVLNNGANMENNTSAAGTDIFEGLGDLTHIAGHCESGDSILTPYNTKFTVDQVLVENKQFLEMMDLDIPLSISCQADASENIQTGAVYAYNDYGNNANQLFSAATLVAGFSSSSMPSRVPYGFDYQANNLFCKEAGVHEIANQGYVYEAALCNSNAIPSEAPETGSRHASQALRGGVHHQW